MTARTECLERAPFVIVSNESSCLPVLAEVARVVIEELGLASEVLPVVSVDTLRLVVLTVLEGTPFCLEVEHVELLVTRVVMNQARFDLQLGVGERTELAVSALLDFAGTELGLVLLYVVETLNISVCELASIPKLALLLSICLAEVRGVEGLNASSVHLGVEVETHLDVVRDVKLAALALEVQQVQVLDEGVAVAPEQEEMVCLRLWVLFSTGTAEGWLRLTLKGVRLICWKKAVFMVWKDLLRVSLVHGGHFLEAVWWLASFSFQRLNLLLDRGDLRRKLGRGLHL